ncbi:metallophosphoesterase [Floccifex sp.]|uniref:metallophosphoesterase n=1 Tax=Floccifex sp. TaxID=2815810 RepID=UPI002A761B57|nr:metallophosphoesterase [Floccifex sp.]MDD7281402.1 metallophosphoesterase family protein [Erysipelotrichaceae bacterium]MDY2957409.1 metallophosphoesterase family protein [Floccifex sp.]
MRYYIADTHFFHRALNTKMDKRGFETVEEMNEYMIQQWNSRIRKNDEVIILGDFSWGSWQETKEVLDCLQGKKFLIRGNHDRFIDDKNFDASYFKWIKDYEELNDNRRKVILSHYPIACYNGQYRKDENGNAKTYMLHGHIHKTHDQQYLDFFQDYVRKQEHLSISGNIEHVPCQFINCFCMYSDYIPLTLDEWICLDEKRRNDVKR